MTQFWNNFVDLCEKNNETPTSVVSLLGISRGSVTHWKNGKTPHPTMLRRIADHFGVSIDYLLGVGSKKIIFSRLQSLCSEKGVSLAYISRKTGITPLAISDDGDGCRLLSQEDIWKIADILDTTPDYLTGETDNKEKPLTVDKSDEIDVPVVRYDRHTREFISRYEQLSPEQKKLVDALLTELSKD